MSGLPYYKRYPRDFLDGTAGMPFELKCAYSVVLDLIYIQRGKLPDDPHYISGHLGCSVRKWNLIREKLINSGKIKAENGIISNLRADKEEIILSKYQDKQRENRSGGNKNKDLQEFWSDQPEPEPEPELNIPPKPPKGGRRGSSKPLPDDWVPDMDFAARIKEELELTREEMNFCYQQMKGHAHATDRRQVNWNAAFGNWLRKAHQSGEIGKQSRGRVKEPSRDPSLD